MPLVRIDLPAATPAAERKAIGEVVYEALVDVAGAPVNDKFVVISAHDSEALLMDPTYVVERTERALIIQITLNAGRSVDVKRRLYRAIADGLHENTGIRTEDVFVSLVEVPKENWSFGAGVAQYAEDE